MKKNLAIKLTKIFIVTNIFLTVMILGVFFIAPQTVYTETQVCRCQIVKNLTLGNGEDSQCSEKNSHINIPIGGEISIANLVVAPDCADPQNLRISELLRQSGDEDIEERVAVTEELCPNINTLIDITDQVNQTNDSAVFGIGPCTLETVERDIPVSDPQPNPQPNPQPDPQPDPKSTPKPTTKDTGSSDAKIGGSPPQANISLVNPIGGSLEKPKGQTDIRLILGSLVSKGLTILGTLTLLVFVAGGALWLTSAGNAERVKKGSTTMLYAVIGIFVIFSSYAILNTILIGLEVGTPEPLRAPSTSSGGSGNNSGGGGATNGSIDCTTLDQASSFTFSCLEKTKCSQGSNVNSELQSALALVAKQVNGPVKSSSGNITILGNAFKNACPADDDKIVCCVDPNAQSPEARGELTQNQKLERLCELSSTEKETYACRTTSFCHKDKTSSLSCGDTTKSCCVAKELTRNETKKVEACTKFGAGYDCRNQSTCERVESGAPVCPGPRSGADKVACCVEGPKKSTCEVKFDGLSCLPSSQCKKSTIGSTIITIKFEQAGENLKNVKGRKLQLNSGTEKWEVKNACDLAGQSGSCCVPKV